METIVTYNGTLKTNPTIYIRNVLTELKTEIIKNIGNETIIDSFLFGSYARNEATELSDIDVCYIYDDKKISEKDINLIVDDICYLLGTKYGIVINALCFSKTYFLKNKDISQLFLNITKEGFKCQHIA